LHAIADPAGPSNSIDLLAVSGRYEHTELPPVDL